MQPNEPLEIGKTADGRPIKLFWDAAAKHYRPAIQKPDGMWVWCDWSGDPLAESPLDEYPVPAALAGGLAGYLMAGPIGALIGSLGVLWWFGFRSRERR
jgi:hypothetical protein